MKISIIAPCFNEEGNLIELCQRINKTFSRQRLDFEIILIDDASTDNTWQIIQDLARSFPIVKLKNNINEGIFKSWKKGLKIATGSIICFIDADLQNPPEAIISLLDNFQSGHHHLIQGYRSSIEWHKDSRFYSSKGLNILLNIFFNDNALDNKSGFILGSKEVLIDVLNYNETYFFAHTFIRISARSKGYSIKEVETLFQPRKTGTSYLNKINFIIIYFKVLLDIFKARFEFKSGMRHPIHSILNKLPTKTNHDSQLPFHRKILYQTYFATMPLHAWLIKSDVKSTLELLKESQWLSRDKIVEFQNWRLQRLVWHVFTNVPYYRKLFQECGIHPSDIKELSDLNKIPLLDKDDVTRNMYMDLFSMNHLKKDMHKISTSGSTGRPFTVFADRQQLEMRFASTMRSYEWAGWTFGDKQLRLWHQKIGMSRTQFLREKLDAFLLHRTFIPAFEMKESTLKKLAQQIEQLRPTLIDGYAESLNFLASYFNQGGKINFSPKGIISSAQTLTTKSRNQIELNFGAKVFDKYGAREFSGIAYQCKHQITNHHVMDESYLVEILKDNKPAKNNETGEVVITDLNNFSFPLIRYRIGDLAVAVDNNSQCPCGRGLSQIGEIQGRTQALVHCANGTWLPGTFFSHFFKEYEHLVKYFQVIQNLRGQFNLRVVKGQNWTLSDWNNMILEIRKFVGETEILVEYVTEIPLLVTGKRTPVVSTLSIDFQKLNPAL